MGALASSGIALDKCPQYAGFAVHTLIIHLCVYYIHMQSHAHMWVTQRACRWLPQLGELAKKRLVAAFPGNPRGSIDIINVQKCWNIVWMKNQSSVSLSANLHLFDPGASEVYRPPLSSRHKSWGTAFLGVLLLHGGVEKPQPVAHPPWPPEGPPSVQLCGQRPLSCQLGTHAIPKNSAG